MILSYSENNELVLKDILGMGQKIDSALILDVNTLNQTTIVVEHPLIKDFLVLISDLTDNKSTKAKIETFQKKLDDIKESF